MPNLNPKKIKKEKNIQTNAPGHRQGTKKLA
jgi:hypothetical protein